MFLLQITDEAVAQPSLSPARSRPRGLGASSLSAMAAAVLTEGAPQMVPERESNQQGKKLTSAAGSSPY